MKKALLVLAAMFSLSEVQAAPNPARPFTQNSSGLTQNNTSGLTQNLYRPLSTATQTVTAPDTAVSTVPGTSMGINQPKAQGPQPLKPAPGATVGTYQAPAVRPASTSDSGLPSTPAVTAPLTDPPASNGAVPEAPSYE